MESRADRLELIERLKGHAGVKAAHEEIVYKKREYEAALGKTLMTPGHTQPFSQREIDYQRGFWRGMVWAYTVFLSNAGPQLNQLLEKALAEKE